MDDDILLAVKELADLRGRTAGEVLSDLAREALSAGRSRSETRNGVPILEATSDERIVTSDVVSRLLDQD